MKAIPVKDKKLYKAANGLSYKKKREALAVNKCVAREKALKMLFAIYFEFKEIGSYSIDEYINFLALHGDEVIEVLTYKE